MERIRPTRASGRNGAGPVVPPSVRVGQVSKSQSLLDTLQNLITGLGTAADRSTGTTFTFSEMGKQQVEWAYRSDWIARKVIDIPAQDSTREWRNWQSDKKEIGELEKLEHELGLQRKTFEAMVKARLYGGAALLLGVDQGRMEEPLVVEKVRKGSLRFVHVVSRWELSGGDLDWDIESEFYGQPKYYTRSHDTGLGKIHPSRVVRFLGAPVPDIATTNGWGDSVLQAMNDAVIAAGLVSSSGSQMISELKLDVIKIPELTASLANAAYEERLKSRFSLANLSKSVYNVLLLDKEEEWERIKAELTGLPDVLRMYLLIVSAAADIPATRMLGQSPAGLSATGESDTRNYYDRIASEQTTVLQPAMSRADNILIRSALGTADPESVFYDWRPLWQMSEEQVATITKSKADAFKVDVDTGLIPDEVLREARINQLIEDGTYPGLEQILEDYGPLEPIEEQPNPEIAPVIDPVTGLPQQPPTPRQEQQTAVADLTRRIRRKRVRYDDATPRTLYVRRQVRNAKELLDWARSVGLTDLQSAKELHVTLLYTRELVDWSKAGEPYGQDEKGRITVPPGGMRMLDWFNSALVLLFANTTLTWRHCDLRSVLGCTVDYPDYQPHITLLWDDELGTQKGKLDLSAIPAYQGAIELGPEIFAETSSDY